MSLAAAEDEDADSSSHAMSAKQDDDDSRSPTDESDSEEDDDDEEEAAEAEELDEEETLENMMAAKGSPEPALPAALDGAQLESSVAEQSSDSAKPCAPEHESAVAKPEAGPASESMPPAAPPAAAAKPAGAAAAGRDPCAQMTEQQKKALETRLEDGEWTAAEEDKWLPPLAWEHNEAEDSIFLCVCASPVERALPLVMRRGQPAPTVTSIARDQIVLVKNAQVWLAGLCNPPFPCQPPLPLQHSVSLL